MDCKAGDETGDEEIAVLKDDVTCWVDVPVDCFEMKSENHINAFGVQ